MPMWMLVPTLRKSFSFQGLRRDTPHPATPDSVVDLNPILPGTHPCLCRRHTAWSPSRCPKGTWGCTSWNSPAGSQPGPTSFSRCLERSLHDSFRGPNRWPRTPARLGRSPWVPSRSGRPGGQPGGTASCHWALAGAGQCRQSWFCYGTGEHINSTSVFPKYKKYSVTFLLVVVVSDDFLDPEARVGPICDVDGAFDHSEHLGISWKKEGVHDQGYWLVFSM